MKTEHIQHIVSEVIRRLAIRLGADGSRGNLITVFTGATVSFKEAIQQVGGLSLEGYRIQLVFSKAAEDLYGQVVRDQLVDFPHISNLDPTKWIAALQKARAVVVPLLSMNTVSKVSQLAADNVPTNLILHALIWGKAVFAARDGADPDGGHWQKNLGAQPQNPALRQAILEKINVVETYGCHLTDTHQLRQITRDFLAAGKDPNSEYPLKTTEKYRSTLQHSAKMVTAADIRQAHLMGSDLRLAPGSVITPLARDLARQFEVAFLAK